MCSIPRFTTGLLAAGLLALPSSAAVPGDSGATKIPFPELAVELRTRLGLDDLAPGTCDLDSVLETGAYVRLDLGTFELWYPRAELAEGGRGEEFEELVLAMVDLHDHWLDYAYFGQPGHAEAKEDVAAVRAWVKKWSPRTLKRAASEEPIDLYELLEADDDVRAASARLRGRAEEGVKARSWKGGWKNQDPPITRLLFCPTRKGFLEHTALAGEIDEVMRPTLWDDAMLNRTSSWAGRTQIVALENAAYPPDIEHPFASSSMNHYSKSGQIQHVVERAAMSLVRDIYYYYGTHFFEQALATNLVIAVTGKNMIGFNYSYSYKRAGATTESYERFIPGGNPTGGALPPRQARPGPLQVQAAYISQWNATEGVEYFREALQKSQRKGQKASKDKDHPLRRDKHAHFQLRNEAGKEAVVSAPFFGPLAEGKELPPDEFLDDYEEFFRAYRSAFFEWIRTRAGDDEQDSLRKFALLIEAQATRDKQEPLHAVVESIYGVPLSAENGETDSLEWRFLRWLPKGR